jgi:hypothetical protein
MTRICFPGPSDSAESHFGVPSRFDSWEVQVLFPA